jgi:transcriptional regulator with XRE-family HTH domain
MIERRSHLGWTQERLAEFAGVKLSMVADCESGRGSMTGEGATKIWQVIEAGEAQHKAKGVRQLFIECRLALELSQDELARRAGIDPLDFSMWEAGQINFDDIDILGAIDDALNQAATEKGLPPDFVEKASHRGSTPLCSLLGGETTKVFGRLAVIRGGKPKRRSFADRRQALSDLRKEAGLRLEELAAQANIPEADLRKFESGQRDLDSPTYCRAFDAALDVLEEKKPTPKKTLATLQSLRGLEAKPATKEQKPSAGYVAKLEELVHIQNELIEAYVELQKAEGQKRAELEARIAECNDLLNRETEVALAEADEQKDTAIVKGKK